MTPYDDDTNMQDVATEPESALDERMKDWEIRLLLTQAELERRAIALDAREAEADAGFARRSNEAREAVRAQMAEERAEHNRRLLAERAGRSSDLDAELDAKRAHAEQALAQQDQREQLRLRQERARHDAALDEEKERFGDEREAARRAIEQQHAEYRDRHNSVSLWDDRLKLRESELAELQNNSQRRADERIHEIEASVARRLADLKSDCERQSEMLGEREQQLRRFEELEIRLGESPDAVLRRQDAARTRIEQLEGQLLALPTLEEAARLRALLDEKREWGAQVEALHRELDTLKAQKTRWLVSVGELEQMKTLKEIEQRHVQALEIKIRTYGVEVDRLNQVYSQPAQLEARMSALTAPWRTDFKRAAPTSRPSEQEWLERITHGCEAVGIRFPRRLLNAFHTSLKVAGSSPLTVLAGVSGTGKSALPSLYARFGGVAFLRVAVQPNWDGPQSLFGYYNSVDSRFNATTLLRAMVQAQIDPGAAPHGLADRLLLVLLDEMNLAHVELYFSDLLSGLESRRDGAVTQEIDLGAGVAPYPLALGENVLWVGTMNEDETTKSLSDKVVDRANTLYFPRPTQLFSRSPRPPGDEAELLQADVWNDWKRDPSQLEPGLLTPFRKTLEQINEALEHAGRALGHRVWQAVESYMANHPDVIAAGQGGDAIALNGALQSAFEDQLVLKVMPKLRGIETRGDAERNCLQPIRGLLGPALAADFDTACRAGYGVFMWSSARYLESAA